MSKLLEFLDTFVRHYSPDFKIAISLQYGLRRMKFILRDKVLAQSSDPLGVGFAPAPAPGKNRTIHYRPYHACD